MTSSQMPMLRSAPPAANGVGEVIRAPLLMLKQAAEVGLAILGIAAMLILAARLASVPLVGGVVFGYMHLVEGRRARGESLAATLRVLQVAPRLGALVLGVMPWVLVLSILWGFVADADIIDPTSPSTRTMRSVAIAISAGVGLHIILAAARGGRLTDYAWPPGHLFWLIARLRDRRAVTQLPDNSSFAADARRAARSSTTPNEARRPFVPFSALWTELDPKTSILLALKNTLAALVWLGPPSLLLLMGQATAPLGLPLALASAVALGLILGWLPFLQARLSAENRLAAAFELRSVRRLIDQAPASWMLAVLVTYAATLPVVIVRIFVEPSQSPILFALVLLAAQFPARVIVGEAYRRACAQSRPPWRTLRWLSTGVVGVALTAYVLLMFARPFIDTAGRAALLSNPAYVVPWGQDRVAPLIEAAIRRLGPSPRTGAP